MINPIIQIRKHHNLERKDLAHMSGIPYDSVWRTEKGLVQHPHEKILEALEQLGYNPDEVRKKYKNYIEDLQNKAFEKAKAN